MTRFEREWALVPAGARTVAGLVCLAVGALMGAVLLLPGFAKGDDEMMWARAPLFAASLLGVALLGVFVLLIGYVFGDARQRGMNHKLWTLLAIFIPNGIGIILYFILRDPVPIPCPGCGTPARKGHAYCAACGAALQQVCPGCRQQVEPGWRNCAHCGVSLAGRPDKAAERVGGQS